MFFWLVYNDMQQTHHRRQLRYCMSDTQNRKHQPLQMSVYIPVQYGGTSAAHLFHYRKKLLVLLNVTCVWSVSTVVRVQPGDPAQFHSLLSAPIL